VERVDRERLKRLLGDAELAWVLDRVRRRLELGQSLEGTIVRRSATPAERDAVARLLGRPPRPARGLSVSLAELDGLVRRSGVHDGGLAQAVLTLTGPVTVRAERTAHEQRAWDRAFLRIEAATAGRPELAAWTARVRAGGLVKRLVGGRPDTARELLDALASVTAALPASGGESAERVRRARHRPGPRARRRLTARHAGARRRPRTRPAGSPGAGRVRRRGAARSVGGRRPAL
jgi:hypothetical protein